MSGDSDQHSSRPVPLYGFDESLDSSSSDSCALNLVSDSVSMDSLAACRGEMSTPGGLNSLCGRASVEREDSLSLSPVRAKFYHLLDTTVPELVLSPSHEAAIPITSELPSGITVDRDEEFWDIDISSVAPEEPVVQDSVVQEVLNDQCLAIVQAGLSSLHESVRLMKAVLGVSTNSSFSGFLSGEHSGVDASVERPIDMDIPMAEPVFSAIGGEPGSDKSDDSGGLLAVERQLCILRQSVSERRKRDRLRRQQSARGLPSDDAPSPVQTRSAGRVEDLPFVQPQVLEYQLGKDKNTQISTGGSTEYG